MKVFKYTMYCKYSKKANLHVNTYKIKILRLRSMKVKKKL